MLEQFAHQSKLYWLLSAMHTALFACWPSECTRSYWDVEFQLNWENRASVFLQKNISMMMQCWSSWKVHLQPEFQLPSCYLGKFKAKRTCLFFSVQITLLSSTSFSWKNEEISWPPKVMWMCVCAFSFLTTHTKPLQYCVLCTCADCCHSTIYMQQSDLQTSTPQPGSTRGFAHGFLFNKSNRGTPINALAKFATFALRELLQFLLLLSFVMILCCVGMTRLRHPGQSLRRVTVLDNKPQTTNTKTKAEL